MHILMFDPFKPSALFWDIRKVANSADPDQTLQNVGLISVSNVCLQNEIWMKVKTTIQQPLKERTGPIDKSGKLY